MNAPPDQLRRPCLGAFRTALRHAGAAAACIALAALAGCAGPQHYSEAERLIASGDPEHALQELRAALQLEPNNAEYRLALRRQLSQMVEALVAQGDDQQRAAQYDAALELFRRAATTDPQSELVRRRIEQVLATQEARKLTAGGERLLSERKVDEASRAVKAALAADSQYAPALELKKKVEAAAEQEERAREAKTNAQSIMKKPISLQLRDANLRMVFESLARVVGLNVILDRDVKTDLKTTIFVKDMPVEDTVNLILLQNQLEKRVINGSTLFIYPATPAKQKEYQELKVKVFDLSNVDAKYIQSLLKSLLKIKDIVIDEKTNTVVIRDTPEAIAVAEKLVAARDVAEPEVMLEVEVLEVSRDRLTNIGVKWPDGFSLSTPKGSGPSGELTLGEFRKLESKDLLLSPPLLSLGVNAQLVDSNANLLASPRIRVRQREKAKILIGDRVPFVSGSNTIAAGANPIVSNTVQYLDVGIKLEVQPNVYAESEVGIKINMEVSSIAKEITNQNTGDVLYQIGTRSASTSLRLKDGETQVLAGLLSDQERTSASKVPGFGQIPVVGRLFSSNSGDATKTEIVLLITPRIVRGHSATAPGEGEIWSGTDMHLSNVPLRVDDSGAMRSIANAAAGTPTPGQIPGARPQPQPIPGAVIPGLRQPAAGVAPQGKTASQPPAGGGAAAPATGAPPAMGTVPPAEVPPSRAAPADASGTMAPDSPQQNIFSPPPPSYVPQPAPAPEPGAPGAGLRVQPFHPQ
jgi:general secretion pathway protein D